MIEYNTNEMVLGYLEQQGVKNAAAIVEDVKAELGRLIGQATENQLRKGAGEETKSAVGIDTKGLIIVGEQKDGLWQYKNSFDSIEVSELGNNIDMMVKGSDKASLTTKAAFDSLKVKAGLGSTNGFGLSLDEFLTGAISYAVNLNEGIADIPTFDNAIIERRQLHRLTPAQIAKWEENIDGDEFDETDTPEYAEKVADTGTAYAKVDVTREVITDTATAAGGAALLDDLLESIMQEIASWYVNMLMYGDGSDNVWRGIGESRAGGRVYPTEAVKNDHERDVESLRAVSASQYTDSEAMRTHIREVNRLVKLSSGKKFYCSPATMDAIRHLSNSGSMTDAAPLVIRTVAKGEEMVQLLDDCEVVLMEDMVQLELDGKLSDSQGEEITSGTHPLFFIGDLAKAINFSDGKDWLTADPFRKDGAVQIRYHKHKKMLLADNTAIRMGMYEVA
ncbi:hypothetical protein [Vibrio sp. WXL210]|uniref:hypothetical protein n=1 Tax=Vibrio sp. WXL210 TaxID=3450709 RepID=UPI003EC6699A